MGLDDGWRVRRGWDWSPEREWGYGIAIQVPKVWISRFIGLLIYSGSLSVLLLLTLLILYFINQHEKKKQPSNGWAPTKETQSLWQIWPWGHPLQRLWLRGLGAHRWVPHHPLAHWIHQKDQRPSPQNAQLDHWSRLLSLTYRVGAPDKNRGFWVCENSDRGWHRWCESGEFRIIQDQDLFAQLWYWHSCCEVELQLEETLWLNLRSSCCPARVISADHKNSKC